MSYRAHRAGTMCLFINSLALPTAMCLCITGTAFVPWVALCFSRGFCGVPCTDVYQCALESHRRAEDMAWWESICCTNVRIWVLIPSARAKIWAWWSVAIIPGLRAETGVSQGLTGLPVQSNLLSFRFGERLCLKRLAGDRGRQSV